MATYRIIAGRLAALQPPIFIDGHIAQREEFDKKTGAKTQFSTLAAHDSTLDGINFIAKDPKTLAKAFDNAKDKWGLSGADEHERRSWTLGAEGVLRKNAWHRLA